MQIPQSRTEDALFRACTAITVGIGQGTKFWLDWWINGQSPKDLAPALYRLTRRKNISVAQGCHARKWLTELQQINTGEEINQLVLLWSLINQVQLSEQPDGICWRFVKMHHEISIWSSVPTLLPRFWMGASVEGTGWKQVQVPLLVANSEQTMDCGQAD
jgi:hypothetical protein